MKKEGNLHAGWHAGQHRRGDCRVPDRPPVGQYSAGAAAGHGNERPGPLHPVRGHRRNAGGQQRFDCHYLHGRGRRHW